MLPIKTRLESYMGELGYQITDIEGPFSGRSGSDVTSVYRFKVNGSKAFLIEKSTDRFDRFVYRGPVPVKPKWVKFLNRFGLRISEGPFLSFLSKELNAYKANGDESWTRADQYKDVPFMEGER